MHACTQHAELNGARTHSGTHAGRSEREKGAVQPAFEEPGRHKKGASEPQTKQNLGGRDPKHGAKATTQKHKTEKVIHSEALLIPDLEC